MKGRGVFITGIGAVSPLGMSVDEMWEGLLAGKCGIDTIKAFDPVGFTCKLAGEVGEFNIRNFVPKSHRKATKLMCRDIELSILAAKEAVENSGLVTKATDPDNVTVDPSRMAITFGAGVICCNLEEMSPSVAKSIKDGKFDLGKWGTDGLESLTPLWLLKYLPNMLACHVGIIHDIRGPSNSLTCGEASGHLAIAEAAEVIARGSAEAVITGGSDAKVNPIMILRQCLIGRAAVDRNGDPEGACRPFDADASGSVFGEGSGILVLEEAEFAKKRGATILAEIVGVGESNNLNAKYESLEAGAVGTQIAIEMALEDAGIEAKELDLVFPHGTGIADDDAAEAEAIANVLGDAVDSVAVWPTKGMLSNTGAAGGALDVVAAIMAMKTGKIGPAKNCNNKADGCKLNIVNEPLDKEVRYALCCSYTFGGQTAAVVLKRYGS